MSENKVLTPIEDVRRGLGLMQSQFKSLFPTQQHVDRFVRVVMTAVQQNQALLEPELRAAFYGACMRCAQDGLMPDGREAALVAYKGKNPTISYQPMVEGMMKKLRNSGEVVGAPRVHVVKEHDQFDYQLGDDEKIVHKPALNNRGKLIGAYSIVRLKSGDTSREFMSFEEIDGIRKRSKKPDDGPWLTDFDEMARKTVFRRHYKRLPRSTDLDNVLAADDDTFVPYAERTPGNSLVPAGGPQQGQEEQKPQAKRPAALEAVAQAGGIQMPTEPAKPVREPATIEGESKQVDGDKPPTDVI
jgi:recombination protein RecT